MTTELKCPNCGNSIFSNQFDNETGTCNYCAEPKEDYRSNLIDDE